MNAAGSRRALLIGASEGGPGCIRFAVDHPDRLIGLVLWGSLAKGSRAPDYPFALTAAQYDLWKQRLIASWGGPAEIETFAPSLAGDRQAETWWAGLLRAASSPGAVTGVLEALRDTDVRHLLAKVSARTMVLHRSGDRAVRVEAGRFLAARSRARGSSRSPATTTGSGSATNSRCSIASAHLHDADDRADLSQTHVVGLLAQARRQRDEQTFDRRIQDDVPSTIPTGQIRAVPCSMRYCCLRPLPL